MFLRQSTSQTIRFGPFLDETDGKSAETGLTISATDMRLSKDGGNFAAKNSGGGTHDEDGWYSATLDSTDTNTIGELILQVTESGALPVWMRWYVVEQDIYDKLFASGGTFNDITAAAAADAVWDEAKSGHTASGSFGEEVQDHALSSEITSPPTAGAIADAVWDEPKTGHSTAGTFGEDVQAHALSTEITALNDLSAAQVNTEVSDVLKTDTISEMAQQAPPATPTFEEAIMYVYMALRNKVDVTSSLKEFHNDSGTVIFKKSLTDDGTVYTEQEAVSGP